VRLAALVTILLLMSLSADARGRERLMDIALRDARARLVALGYPEAATADVSGVQLLEMPGRMPCSGQLALGCFAVYDVPVGKGVREYGVMAYARIGSMTGRQVHKVLIHEWTHALLWKLRDPTWEIHDKRFR